MIPAVLPGRRCYIYSQRYKRIAYIGGPEHLLIFRDRKEGFLSAMEEAGKWGKR